MPRSLLRHIGSSLGSVALSQQGEQAAVPIHLGSVGRASPLTIGAHLDLGQSRRFLRKNRRTVVKLLDSSAHDPFKLLQALGSQLVS